MTGCTKLPHRPPPPPYFAQKAAPHARLASAFDMAQGRFMGKGEITSFAVVVAVVVVVAVAAVVVVVSYPYGPIQCFKR